jgi:hypothetical protein
MKVRSTEPAVNQFQQIFATSKSSQPLPLTMPPTAPFARFVKRSSEPHACPIAAGQAGSFQTREISVAGTAYRVAYKIPTKSFRDPFISSPSSTGRNRGRKHSSSAGNQHWMGGVRYREFDPVPDRNKENE